MRGEGLVCMAVTVSHDRMCRGDVFGAGLVERLEDCLGPLIIVVHDVDEEIAVHDVGDELARRGVWVVQLGPLLTKLIRLILRGTVSGL